MNFTYASQFILNEKKIRIQTLLYLVRCIVIIKRSQGYDVLCTLICNSALRDMSEKKLTQTYFQKRKKSIVHSFGRCIWNESFPCNENDQKLLYAR